MKIEMQSDDQTNIGRVPGLLRRMRFDAPTGSGGLAQHEIVGDDAVSQAAGVATKEGQVI